VGQDKVGMRKWLSTQEAGGSRSFHIVFVLIPHMWSGDGGSVSMIRIALDIECYWYRTHLFHCTVEPSTFWIHTQIRPGALAVHPVISTKLA